MSACSGLVKMRVLASKVPALIIAPQRNVELIIIFSFAGNQHCMYQLVKDNRSVLLHDWIEFLKKNNDLTQVVPENELQKESEEFLDHLIAFLKLDRPDDTQSTEYQSLTNTLSTLSRSRARLGLNPRTTGSYILSFKEIVLENLKEHYQDDPLRVAEETLRFNRLLDSLSILTFEAYIESRQNIINRQNEEINEISTPVIQVWDGILALPIIGTLDSSRTQVVMESLLEAIVKTESSVAILDISGVPAVDSLTAQHLIKTVSATRLMGAECIISGIRPETAQTIVQLGIDLTGVTTKSTLASALKQAIRLTSSHRNSHGKDSYS